MKQREFTRLFKPIKIEREKWEGGGGEIIHRYDQEKNIRKNNRT